MAGYNEILVGRFARGLQKLTGIKGGPPTPTLSGDIIATIPTAEDGVENSYLFGWQRYMIQIRQLGGVALNANVRFRNPLANNVIAVLEAVWLAISTGNVTGHILVTRGQVSTDLPTAIPSAVGSRLDSRGNQSWSVVISEGQGQFSLNNGQARYFLGTGGQASTFNPIADQRFEWPVLPGDAVQFDTFDNGPGVAFEVSLLWRERFLEESERA